MQIDFEELGAMIDGDDWGQFNGSAEVDLSRGGTIEQVTIEQLFWSFDAAGKRSLKRRYKTIDATSVGLAGDLFAALAATIRRDYADQITSALAEGRAGERAHAQARLYGLVE